MITIDSMGALALTADDISRMDASQVSDPDLFKRFAAGVELDACVLSSDRWDRPEVQMASDVFGVVMHEMLPEFYSIPVLESLGGTFALRLTDLADYTVAAVNRRVVVFSGLPVDHETNEEVIDLEMAPDVFIAFCRGIMLDLSEDILAEDDESEDRIVSPVELSLIGMPAGGNPRDPNWPPRANSRSWCGINGSAGVCSSNASGCATNGSAAACRTNAAACGANLGTGACLTNGSACFANGGVAGCAANAGACAMNAVAQACGANAGACAANGVAKACGANAGACAVNGGAQACGINTGACAVNGGGACAVNAPLGDPISFCIVNVIPLLPSC